jgi:hypothetical protein
MRLFARLALISLFILILPANLVTAGSADLAAPVPGDLSWDAALALPGLDSIQADSSTNFPYHGDGGMVWALLSAPDGNVYAGGEFTLASGQPARNVARWDGTRWLPLGDGLPWTVKALALDSAGNLYAGGTSVVEASQEVSHLARWNGTTWQTLASFTGWEAYGGPEVDALAVDGSGNLYVGGVFTLIDGQKYNGSTYNSIARWSSNSGWTTLGMGGGVWNYGGGVYALWADPAGNLYAGGSFGEMGGVQYTNGVAYWDRTQWHPLFIGVGTVDQLGVGALGKLYTIGASGVMMWNGNVLDGNDHWTALHFPSLTSSFPSALWVGSDGTVIAGGTISLNSKNVTALMNWTGTGWMLLGASNDANGGFSALTRTPNGMLYAGGAFKNFAGLRADNIIRNDGVHWYTVGEGQAPVPAVTDVSTFIDKITFGPDGTLYAATTRGYDHSVLRFDGASWQQLGPTFYSPHDYGGVAGLIVDHSGSLYVAGQFNQIGAVTVNNIARWDGNQWQPLLGGVTAGVGETVVPKVDALAMDDAGNLYVAGLFQSASGLPVDGFAIWDGLGWSKPYGAHLTCDENCEFTALAWDPVHFQMYLGGVFNVDGAWRQVGVWSLFYGYQGIPGEPFDSIIALALDGAGNLYAGAQYTFYSTGGLEMWDGQTWSTPANITPQSISAPEFILRTDGQGRVIVGGGFTSACGTTMFFLTRLENGGCVPYGSGLSGWVTDLAFDPQGRLVASGYFNGAGSRRVEGLARWTGAPPPARLSLNFQTARPGSAINVSGMYFNPGGLASVWLNGQLLSSGVSVDGSGTLTFQLTSAQAAIGWYGLSVTQTSSTGTGRVLQVDSATLPSASASFRLDAAYPLRELEGVHMALSIPPGIGFTHGLFLPYLRR